MFRIDSLSLGLAGTSWLLASAAGMSVLWRYSSEPGPLEDAPSRWPPTCSVLRDPDRPTLVLLAHPRCPCTRASLEELDRLLARCGDAVSAHVLFYSPADGDAGWSRGDLWTRASAIPGVSVRADVEGVEASRFGATVSGLVVLYDRDGALLYHGGITAGRGHSGDNDGSTAILSSVTARGAVRTEAPVYGCSIRGEDLEREERW